MHSDVVEAASWQLAAQVCRHIPDLVIRQTCLCGGFYDCLFDSRGVNVADCNRHGSVHVFGGRVEPLVVWENLHQPNTLTDAVKTASSMLGAPEQLRCHRRRHVC